MSDLLKKAKARTTTSLVAEISQAELACRLFEVFGGIEGGPRPYPTSAEKSMDALRSMDPLFHDRAKRAAEVAVLYMAECIKKGVCPS